MALRKGMKFMLPESKSVPIFAITIVLLLNVLASGFAAGEGPQQSTESQEDLFLSLTTTVAVDAGEDFYIYFDPQDRVLVQKSPPSLPAECIQALEMVPEWMRFNLSYKFRQLSSSYQTTYANLIINSPDEKYIDEIAFVIAHSAVDNLQDDYFFPELITHNAQLIYENDQYLNYVDIVERGDYTTVIYKDKDGRSVELERDLYYWFIVHPKLSDELPTYVDPDYDYTKQPPFDKNYGVPPEEGGEFWREWLFYSNDSGYPLLKDMFGGANTLWEAISVCNDWISASMSFTSNEERPIQPVRIYRKHIGRCGEYQDMRNAIARAGLIPSTCTSNQAEDHMWDEFWDNRWIHWDGTVDNPRMYEDGWGKKLSSVWNFRGDSGIWSVSEKYTDVCNFTATVLDSSGMPVDGALVDVLTEFYYNNSVLTTTTWGTTDFSGQVTIPLGDERNYWSQAESSSLGNDPLNGATQIITDSVAGENYTHTFNLPLAADELNVQEITNPGVVDPKFRMNVKYEVLSSIVQTYNSLTGEEGESYLQSGNIDFFIADNLNYNLYATGLSFDAFNVDERSSSGEHLFVLPTDDIYYSVLSNGFSQATTKIIRITVEIYSDIMVDITAPSGTEYSLGEIIYFTGSAWGPSQIEAVEINVDGLEPWFLATDLAGTGEEPYTTWDYYLNTTGLMPGEHRIFARASCGENSTVSFITIRLNDDTDPQLSVISPLDFAQYILGDTLVINGTASDNVAVARLDLTIDSDDQNRTEITSYLQNGFYSYQMSTYDLGDGDHTLKITAYDPASNTVFIARRIKILEAVAPQVFIESPASGTIFPMGDVVEIMGSAHDNKEVAFLSIKIGTGSPQDITASLQPDGSWSYLWDTNYFLDGPNTILVECRDRSNNTGSDSIDVILDENPPVGSIDRPQQSSRFVIGEKVTISGTASDDFGLHLVYLLVDEDYPVNLLPYLKDGFWSVEIDSEDLGEGSHSVKLNVADEALHVVNDTVDFSINEGIAPYVQIEKPKEGFMVKRGELISISGHASDNRDVQTLNIQFDGATPIDITSNLREDGFWFYEWNTNGAFTYASHMIRVTAQDSSQNIASDEISMIVDGDNPLVTMEFIEDESVYKAGVTIELKGTVKDDWKVKDLVLQLDGGSKIGLTGKIQGTLWKYGYANTGALQSGKHTFTLTARDSVGHESQTSLDFTVDARVPELEFDDIQDSIEIGDVVIISGFAGDDIGVAAISLIVDNGEPISLLASYSNGIWRYDLDTKGMAKGRHSISVEVTDGVDNQVIDELSIRLIEKETKPEPQDEGGSGQESVNMIGPFELQMFLLLVIIIIICLLAAGAALAFHKKRK